MKHVEMYNIICSLFIIPFTQENIDITNKTQDNIRNISQDDVRNKTQNLKKNRLKKK